MKIKAFGMEIQVTESAVFVNGKEVYNKIEHSHNFDFIDEMLAEISPLEMKKIEKSMMDKTDQAEQRMNVIGQNGNDGLHYGFWEQINTDLFNKDRLTDSNDPNDKTGIDY